MEYQCAIFDLDGVLVDTAKYHYLAWKVLANRLGIIFTLENNEMLKGISRMDSLEILLRLGNLQNSFSQIQKEEMAQEKNALYVKYISNMDASEVLDGARELLTALRQSNVKIALGSASKNTPLILKTVDLTDCFDVIIDGNVITKAKPDPEVFAEGAERLGIEYTKCVVFEDSQAGIEAAGRLGMLAVGIGNPAVLHDADMVISTLAEFDMLKIFKQIA